MRLPNSLPLALVPFLLLQLAAARAQGLEEEDLALVYGNKSTVSIATGNVQPLRRAPAVASVITAEDIAAMGATDLDEVLETIPGMHVARSAVAYAPLYAIRGIFSGNNPQVLMLQNGIPVTTMFQGNKGGVWGGLPLENVARIEVIRGPGSALYGADAYAGVINIITNTAADTPGTHVGVRAGSESTWDTWVQHGGKLGPFDLATYLRVGNTQGISEVISADAQTRNDQRFGTSASRAPGSVHTGREAIDGSFDLAVDRWRLRGGYKLRDNVEGGVGVNSALDPVGRARSERITSDISWLDPQFSESWGVGLTAGYLQYNDTVLKAFQLLPPGAKLATGTFIDGMIGMPEKWERQLRLSAFANYTGFQNHQVRFGIGHDDLNLYKTRTQKNYVFVGVVPTAAGPVADYSLIQPFMEPQRRKLSYFYVQDEWQLARDWALTAGLRRDVYSDFGGTTNPRLALVWDATLDLTAKLLAGRAFRAPSFAEEYSINNPVQRGNPNLEPETITTLEAALSWQARKDTHLNFNLFHYAMKDIIRLVPTTSTFSNTGNQNGRGVELEVVWDAGRSLRLTGNYSFQRSIDEATNQDAGYAPRNHLYARADWRFASGWMMSGQLNSVAERKRVAGDTRPDIPNYTTVDMTVRSNGGRRQWALAASIRNLFAADVREPSLAPGLIPNDLPVAPRSFWLQATYKL